MLYSLHRKKDRYSLCPAFILDCHICLPQMHSLLLVQSLQLCPHGSISIWYVSLFHSCTPGVSPHKLMAQQSKYAERGGGT